MGTRNDLYRRNRVRVDDDDLQFRIKLTRRWIFEQGVSLTSVYMKRMLDPLSITPTRVSSAQVCVRHMSLTKPSPECLLHPTASIRIQLLFTLRTRPASRVRVGRVEIGFHAPSPHSLRGRWRCDSRVESAVRSSMELYGCDTDTPADTARCPRSDVSASSPTTSPTSVSSQRVTMRTISACVSLMLDADLLI